VPARTNCWNEPGGRKCRCGARGCLEAHAGGWAIVEQAEAAGFRLPDGPLRPGDVFAAARQGHPAACAVIQHAAEALGMGLASFCALYQPERIVLGGNVLGEGYDLLLPRASQRFRSMVQPWMASLALPLSSIAQTAGVLGGAALVLYHWEERLRR